jgi:hypothetical protein
MMERGRGRKGRRQKLRSNPSSGQSKSNAIARGLNATTNNVSKSDLFNLRNLRPGIEYAKW